MTVVVAVSPHHLERRARHDVLLIHPVDVRGNLDDAVGVVAGEIRPDGVPADDRRLLLARARGLQQPAGDNLEPVGLNRGHVRTSLSCVSVAAKSSRFDRAVCVLECRHHRGCAPRAQITQTPRTETRLLRYFAQRVAVYIDGFNLFYGLRDKGWRRYYWLDARKLAENLLRPGQTLTAVRYFTARVYPDAEDPGKVARQNTYLEALGTISGLSTHYGHFLPRTRRCPNCGQLSQTYEEKMTDVNIAVEMVRDAQEDLFDAAIVVSADSDLSRPITAIRERFPDKRTIVAFPPNRFIKPSQAESQTRSFLHATRYNSEEIASCPNSIAKHEWNRPHASRYRGARGSLQRNETPHICTIGNVVPSDTLTGGVHIL